MALFVHNNVIPSEVLMRKIRLGKTEMRVPELGFGGIPITRVEREDAIRLLRYCFERGITFYDTANLYGDSEDKIGETFKDIRDQVVLATKTILRDAAGAMREVERSLKRLQTETIDLYQLHNVSSREDLDQIMAPGGACEAMVKAREDGKIKHIGFSAHNIDIAIEACRTGLFSTIQIPFNIIEHDPADELFGVARQQDMGIIAMKPLGGGILDRADLCFGFLRQFDDVVAIPGMESLREVDENLGYYKKSEELSAEDWDDIEKLREETGDKFCHRCGYCQPCPEGVEIWRVLLFKAQLKRFPPEMALGMAKDPMKSAEDCIECGECEEKCPYELPIPDLIKENLDYYRDFCARNSL